MTTIAERLAAGADDDPDYPCCEHCDHQPGLIHGDECDVTGCPGAVPIGGAAQ